MTMHLNFSPEMEQYLKSKVSSGFYGNVTEVIRDAIRRMQAEEAQLSALRAAVAKGDAQLEGGEGTAYSSALMESMVQTAKAQIGSGQPMDPDVLPR